jgi:hypothetical protein
VRLLLGGLAAGTAVGLIAARRGARCWGPAAVLTAAVWGAAATGRWDGPTGRSVELALAALVLCAAGAGTVVIAGTGRQAWRWVAAGALLSLSGVFLAVPETGPAVVAAGVTLGLVGAAVSTRSGIAPLGGAALAVLVGWAALSGAVGRSSAVLGGCLCTGLAPWLALRGRLPTDRWGLRPGWWLLAVHGALVIAAARWVAIAPTVQVDRASVLIAAALLTTIATRWRPA